MSRYLISNQQALGSEIKALTTSIEPHLANHTRAAIIITMLSIAVLIQEPELDADHLQSIISDLSKRIALLIEDVDPDAPSTVN